jgi:hypothetical protein
LAADHLDSAFRITHIEHERFLLLHEPAILLTAFECIVTLPARPTYQSDSSQADDAQNNNPGMNRRVSDFTM